MANPVAAHTFDFVRIYLSTRTGGAPGSGAWSNPVTIFDGTLYPSFGKGETFSAGALGPTDQNNGIIVHSQFLEEAFLGNGLPTAPLAINIAVEGQLGNNDYWDMSQGAWSFGGNFYIIALSNAGTVRVYKSSDGVNYTAQDTSHEPPATTGPPAAVQRVGNAILVFTHSDNGGVNFAAWTFDLTVSSNQWSASFAPIALVNFEQFSSSIGGTWTGGVFQFPNGDIAVLYDDFGAQANIILWTKLTNSWSSEIVLPGGHYANSVMDAGLQLIHVFTYDAGSTPRNTQVHYSTFAHVGAVLTPDIDIIPAPVSSSDGVGHCSIQNGMLFVPRDDAADFDNSVWVAALPVTIPFQKEALPVPPGETNTISAVAVNPGGINYVVGDTGTINGGTAGHLAKYTITGVVNNAVATFSSGSSLGINYVIGDLVQIQNGSTKPILQVTSTGAGGSITGGFLTNLGAGCSITNNIATIAQTGIGSGFTFDILTLFNGVSGLNLNDGGGGYSVTPSAGTTNGGSQPGVGTGLTLNILSVKGKTPSCAYMMFPNGYSIVGTIGITCPIGGGAATVGVPYNSGPPVVTGNPTLPLVFTLIGGALPPGMTLDPATGAVSGTTFQAGTFSYTIEVTDSSSPPLQAQVSEPCSIPVSPGTVSLPCASITPNPSIDVRFKLIKVMATMKPATHLPTRGSVT